MHMEDYIIKNCQACHQPLRIPANIGGMLMRCPNCGYEFHTDFRLAQDIQGPNIDQGAGQKRMPPKSRSSTFNIIA